jgi:hypothetical protein
MTPRSYAKDRADTVKQAVELRGDKAASSAKLRSHPNYPMYVNVIGPDDEYPRELLERAWQEDPNESPTELASDEQLLRPWDPTDKISGNTAVYRTSGVVQQLVAKRTSTETSVLGRVGVIDIYREQLETTLKEKGLKLTAADLARLIIDKDAPLPEEVANTIKLLARLNAGHYVSEGSARTAAEKLHLWVEDLVFDSAIYDSTPRQRGSARKRRREQVRQSNEKERARLRVRLRSHQVSLIPLRIGEANSVQQFHSAMRGSNRIEFAPLNQEIGSDAARCTAVANFTAVIGTELEVITRIRLINQAWAELESLGVQLWMGQYEDLVRLQQHETDPPGIPKGSAKSRAVKVLVIAFSEIGVPLPSISRDLSHTVDLMPSAEQLISAAMDDPPP